MELSRFIAKLLAVVYCSVGLGIILNPDYYRRMFDEMIKQLSFIYLGGVMSLAIGFLIINSHNTWESNWTILITIFGWLALIKGVAILVTPEKFTEFSKNILQKENSFKTLGIFTLALGFIFTYLGFCTSIH